MSGTVDIAAKMAAVTDREYVGDEALAWLQRWEDAGGTWRILARDRQSVTVSLLRCDGGEEADRFTSDGPRLFAFIDGRGGN